MKLFKVKAVLTICKVNKPDYKTCEYSFEENIYKTCTKLFLQFLGG